MLPQALTRVAAFAGVGVVNSLIDLFVFLLAMAAGVPPLVAHVVGFAAGGLNSFLMNGLLTFRRRLVDIAHWRTVVRFIGILAVQFSIGTAVFWLVHHVTGWPVVAKLVAIGITTVASFLLMRRVFAVAR